MKPQRNNQQRVCVIAAGMLCAIMAIPTLAHADAFGAAGVGPSDDIIQGAPSVTGFVNDGDETVVDTVLLYMNGCPLVSITPPDGGRGMPVVTSIEQSGDCVAGRGTEAGTLIEARGDRGMHVQLWTDPDAEDLASLVIEVSSLYPDALPETMETMAVGMAPSFFIPGVFGDPSGDLTLASGGGGGGGNVWGGGGTTPGWPGGGSGGGSGGGGSGGGNVPGGGFLNTTPGGPPPPAPPPIAAVPLPATLLLLLWALQLLRSYVRRT